MEPILPSFVRPLIFAICVAAVSQLSAQELSEQEAQAQFDQMVEEFGWEREGTGKVGKWAEVVIPQGYRFTSGKGARKLMEIYGNVATDIEEGLIAPENLDWFVLFEFDKSGYVKDDEKDQIDAAELLKAMQEGQNAANKYREDAGLEKLFVTGWHTEPFYNEETNNLEWALLLRDESNNDIVNYKTKLLGRYGVMDSVLVCEPSELDSILPTYQNILAGYNYVPGNTYAEYKSGDKVAEYGLTALIVGGGAAAAAKLGLFAVIGKFLAKAWKLVVVGVVAIGAGIKRLFGGGRKEYDA